MHTGHHGKSKSRKPEPEAVNVPQDFNKVEVEKTIVEYARKGMPSAQIGQELKDKHNVPYVKQYFGKRLGVILKENKVSGEIPQDMMDLLKRAVIMRRHLVKNHNDVHNRVRLGRVEAKIWRLSKYYKRTGALPATWKYEPEKVALMIKS
jgi:small subunit ribosomal protein S15